MSAVPGHEFVRSPSSDSPPPNSPLSICRLSMYQLTNRLMSRSSSTCRNAQPGTPAGTAPIVTGGAGCSLL